MAWLKLRREAGSGGPPGKNWAHDVPLQVS